MSRDDRQLMISVRADIRQALRDLKAVGAGVGTLEKQGKKGGRGMKALARDTLTAQRQLISMNTVLAAGGLALYLRHVVKVTDGYKGMQGQLKLVTSSSAELAEVNAELFTVAQGSYSGWRETSALYSRMARNAKKLGLAQREMLDLTQLTNEAIQVGGATASEAAGGIQQFTQAISTKFAGDEFKSIAENMPVLMQAIQDGLKVDRGELRRMSEAGELSAKLALGALQTQQDKIHSQFLQLPRAVGHAITQMNNQWMMALKDTDMSPLIDGIDDFRKQLEDPHTVEAITDLTAGIVTAFGWATSAVVTTVGVVQWLGEEMARAVGGADTQAKKVGEKIEALQLQLSSARQMRGRRGAKNPRIAEIKAEIEQLKQLQLKLFEEEGAHRFGANYSKLTKGDKKDPKKKPSDEPTAASKEQLKLAEAVKKTTEALQLQIATMGLSGDRAAIFKLKMDGATDAQLKQARAAADLLETLDQEAQFLTELAEAAADLSEQKLANAASDQSLIAGMEQQIELAKLAGDAQIRLTAVMSLSADATDEQKKKAGELAVELDKLGDNDLDQMDEFARQAARNMQSAFADFLFDPFDKGLQGMVLGFANSLRRMTAEMLAAQALRSMLTAAGGSLGGSTGAALTAMAANVNHSGGMAGSGPTRSVHPMLMAMAPRFHSGGFPGIAANEYPSILEKGEEVLAKDNPRNALNGGGSGGVTVVNITDKQEIADYLDSSDSDTVFVNKMSRNAGVIKQILGG